MTRPADVLRLHRFEPASQANGPGLRAVLWVQGCGLGCPGCFNPETHDLLGGYTQSVAQVVEQIRAVSQPIEGLTISGGEPFYQPAALAELARQLRAVSGLSILVFSGFRWDEIARIPRSTELLEQIDVLIAGRYEAGQRVARGLLGSANKTVHFLTSRYTPADLEPVPEAEIVISPDGEIRLSGIDPLTWK